MNVSSSIALVLFLTSIATPCAADNAYKKLFENIPNKLSLQEQKAIYSALDLNGQLVCEVTPENFNVELKDINGDGVTEVFIIGGNACTSGVTGSTIWLFIKQNRHAIYKKNLDFPAGGYKILLEKSKGFPDIQVGGSAFCDGVWRWSGRSYSHYKNIPTAVGGCNHVR